MSLDVDAAMGRALELAAAAREWGDTPIGAVVLGPDGAVLAEAANEREKQGDPTAHAEVLALRAAARVHGDGWRLWRRNGATPRSVPSSSGRTAPCWPRRPTSGRSRATRPP
ncbi:MAG TPA: deaminase, partial [Blastococcus sp.]